MSGGQSYSVDVVYQGHDRGATAMADSIGNHLVGLQGRIDSLLGAFHSLAGGAAMLGVGGAMAGVRALYSGVANLNAQAESTTLTIAGMLNANGVAPSIAAGMTDAAATLRQIRVDAAALPGEASEFVEVFQTALPAALQAGMRSGMSVAAFTNQFGAVGKSFGVDAGQIGRDLRFMLQGHAGGQVAMWNHLGPLIGKSAEQFNQMTAPQRLATLQTVTARYGGMVQAFGGTWEAATSTITSAGSELLRVGTAPLFDQAKHRVMELGNYLAAHGPEMEATARRWGEEGARAFDMLYERGRAGVTWLRQNWRGLADDVRRDGRDLVSLYSTLRATSAGLSLGNTIAPAVQGVAGLLGSGAGAGGAGAAAAGASVAGLGAIAATAAVGLGAIAVAANNGSISFADAANRLQPTAERVSMGFSMLRRESEPLIAALGTHLFNNAVRSAEALGTVVTAYEGAAATILRSTRYISEHSPAVHAIQAGGSFLGRIGDRIAGFISPRVEVGMAPPVNDSPLPRDVPNFRALAAVAATAAAQQQRPDTRPRPQHNNVTINMRVEQADNPERVALTVLHVMQRELRNPTQARYPGASTPRPAGR